MAGGPGGQEVGRISIRVLPDTSHFRRDLQRQLEEIERTVRGRVRVDADLDPAGVRAQMRALLLQLEAMARVTVRVDVDRSALGGILGSLGSIGQTGGTAARSMSRFAGSIAMVAVVASLLAPALALISGVLVSLPALIAAVAIPIGALVLGFDGIKNAAKVLGPSVDTLKKAMSQTFEDRFTPVFEKLSGVFPVLLAELPKVANALGDFAEGFVDAVTSAPGLEAIRNTIANVATAISQAAPGIRDFTQGILILASKVSNKLPGLSQMFNNFSTNFLEWVNRITTAGPDGVSPLDRALKSLKDTLSGLGTLIGGLVKDGFDLLSDPQMGANIKASLESVRVFFTETLPLLNDFFSGLSDILNLFNTKVEIPEWLSGVGKIAKDAFGSEVDPTAPDDGEQIAIWAAKVREAFNAVKTWATDLGTSIGLSLRGAFQSAYDGMAGFVMGVRDLGTQFGTLIGQTVETVRNTWNQLPAIASQVWGSVKAAVQAAIADLVATVQAKAAEVVAEISSWPGKFKAALGDLGGALVGAGAALVQGLINGITSRIGAAVAAAADLASKVAAAAKGALGIKSPSKVFHEIGVYTMQGFQDGIEKNQKSVIDSIGGFADEVSEAMSPDDKIGEAWNTAFAGLKKAPMDFAKTTAGSVLSDLGIGGQGAFSQAFEQGMGLAEQFIFNVSSMDEALTAKNNITNKKALQFV